MFGLPVVCLADQPYTLNTGSPAGGTYSGTGVNAGTFDPAVAGIGTFGITYTFTDSAGCTSSATDSVMVDACMGINTPLSISNAVFPNPSSGIFNINVSANCRATLFNSLGAVVQESSLRTGTNQLGDSNLTPGIYYLNLVSNNNSETIRIVIAEEK
ncbi:MAG: T9SS type A sorting domain-containing protein [Bacteroidia bacterium]|nr:T9SS type A sorting domain-containing protein [Bacteroidia bacterium]